MFKVIYNGKIGLKGKCYNVYGIDTDDIGSTLFLIWDDKQGWVWINMADCVPLEAVKWDIKKK